MSNSSKKILIVEDDMLLSFVEERIVKKLGYQVAGKATNGPEAIELAANLKPDLIIMDILLKGSMDGVETMKKIRETSEVPVIYLSGNSDEANMNRAKETDFAGYLVKPVTAQDLAIPLHQVLNDAPVDGKSGTPGNNSHFVRQTG